MKIWIGLSYLIIFHQSLSDQIHPKKHTHTTWIAYKNDSDIQEILF